MRQLKIIKQVTNRETASLDKYLQEIGREDMISADEEVQLAIRIRQGDRAALERLTRANLRFVVSVSKQYQNQGLALPDLINEGNMGLIKAAEWDVGEYFMGSGVSTTVLELAKGKKIVFMPDRKEDVEVVVPNTTPNWQAEIKVLDYIK